MSATKDNDKEMSKVRFLALAVEVFLVALAKEAEESIAKMTKSLFKFHASMEKLQELLENEQN